jgi:hypothetical protein
MELRVVAVAAAAAFGDVAAVTATSKTFAAVQSYHFLPSPASSVMSLDNNRKTTTKAEAKSGTSPSYVYSCTTDGGYPIVNRVIDNPYSKIIADFLRQAFGLIEEEKKSAFAQQVDEGKAALAVALDGTGISPVKDLR